MFKSLEYFFRVIMNHFLDFKAKHIFKFMFFILFCVVTSHSAIAVEQLQTKYFTIIYDEGGEFTAGEISKFCDDIYEKLMAQYDSFTDDPSVLCIVNDAVDLATGYAIYFQNTITVYATNMDYELRGQTNWLKNVFAHEMAHMIALKKAAKGPVNFVSLGGGKYNENPDFNVDILFYHLSQPAWFSEGTAQIGAESFGSEHWDTHREMLLRSAWLENSFLTFEEMSTLLGKKSISGEMVYNQGYSMVRYIKEKYGYDKVVELNNSSGYFDFNPTIKRVLGISAEKLYDDWLAYLDDRYASFNERSFVEGEEIEDKGSADYYPVLSPDGRYFAWLSNRGKDYAITDLMLKDMSTGKTKVIVKNVDYRISWSHDSTKLIYVRRPDRNPSFYDIYLYDVTTEKERRISKNMRARDPSFCPDDSLIVFVRNAGGNNTLSIVNSNGAGLRYLTSAHDGTQFYSPSFSPDGSKILFGLYRQNIDRDIGLIDADAETYRHKWEYADSNSAFSDSTLFGSDNNFTLLLGSKFDERDPRFLPDGDGIVYVSDRTGVFNVYKLNFETDRATRLTDLYGGAFSPSVDKDDFVYYAGYKADNFSIYRISLETEIDETENVIEERDYIRQPEVFDLSEHFDVVSYKRRRIVNAIVPSLRIGPSFIGSKFGLNVVDVGATIYISDLLGYDALLLSGNVGKNLKEDVSLNSNFNIYYERAMVPITSSEYTHSPRFYLGASRTVINNYIHRLEATADSAFYDDMPDLGYGNVLHDLHQKITIDDEYRDEFRRYRLGIFFPLANRHVLVFEAGLRQYYETMKRYEIIRDFSNFFHEDMDVTEEIPTARKTSSYDTRFFTDMKYFQSREFSVNYFYSKSVPTADSDISPKGTYLTLQFRHLRTAVTDSLVEQPSYFVPFGIDSYGFIYLDQYNPDPLLDELRPYKNNVDVNEYFLGLQEYRQLPFWRHTLNATIFAAYRDISLKDYRKGEGSGLNWPLKYYLGGGNMLCGYPYFAFWGPKIFYSRFGYTFPIRHYFAKDILGVNFQRVYGNIFFEAGKTWNFKKISMDRLKEGTFKRDIGFEMRCKMIAFYRLSVLAYVRIAWPLDDMGGSPYKNDARRFYFGLVM